MQPAPQDLHQTFGCDGPVGITQEEHFFDVADGETTILQLPDETNALEDSNVVDAMTALGAPRLLEESGAFVKPNGVSCDAATRRDIPNSKTF